MKVKTKVAPVHDGEGWEQELPMKKYAQHFLAGMLLTIASCGNAPESQPIDAIDTAEDALNVSNDYAGSYTTSDPGSLSGCAYSNVLSGWCGCPEGSTSFASMRLLHDSFGTGILGGTLHYCGPSSRTPADFGGAFQVDDPVPGGVGCRVGNSSNGGRCSCPTNTFAIPLRVIVDSSAGWIGSTVNYCRRSSPSGFGGAYQQDDAVPGGRGCRNRNPFTGSCSCPSGYTKNQSLRAIVDGAGGFIGSTIHTCAPSVPSVTLCPGHTADPTGTVSARAALQACIDANYFNTLSLPPGDFLIDGNEGTDPSPGLSITSRITITTQGTASQGACLSSSSVPCARFLAGPGLYRNGGIVKITGAFVTLDHIILDGNRSGRVNTGAWLDCANGFNRRGFNAQVDHAFGVAFLNSASTNAVCGTGLEWWGDSANIKSSRFQQNGDHNSNNMWSDGLTLLQSNNAILQDNRFIDGSDIGFIMGGGTNSIVENNIITQSGQKAFAGLMMDNFNGLTSGLYDGAMVEHNTITCSPWSQCDYGVNLGPHAWYSGSISGGTFTQNTVSGGYIALNVDGATGFTVTANTISTGAGTSQICGIGASNFNVAPDSSVTTDMFVQSRNYTHDCHP